MSKVQPEWLQYSNTKKLAHLQDHQTIADSIWTTEFRLYGEKRADFLKRVLGRKSPTVKKTPKA